MLGLSYETTVLKDFLYKMGNMKNWEKYPLESFVLLDITFPILFSFRKNSILYLCYVLRYKKKKRFSAIISETTYSTLLDLVTQKCSIYNSIKLDSSLYVMRRANDSFTIKTGVNLRRLLPFLPSRKYLLTEAIPNKADLISLQKIFKRRLQLEQRAKKRMNTDYAIGGISIRKTNRLYASDRLRTGPINCKQPSYNVEFSNIYSPINQASNGNPKNNYFAGIEEERRFISC